MFKSNSFSTKRAYDAPLCEALEVKFEGNVLTTSGDPGKAGQDLPKGNSYSFYYDD